MTPPATATSARTTPGSRRAPVRGPRRVSGPASSRRGAVAAVAIPAPGIVLPRQRPSGPAVKRRRVPAPKRALATDRGAPGIALRAIDLLNGLSSSAVLDRLIRGRAWIGLLAFALIGIVAMQLFVLKLNTGIGRTLTHVAQLQRENAQLGIEDSASSAESRIAPTASAAGMTLAPLETVHFVAASPAYISRAAAVLSAPLQTPASRESSEGSSGSVGESSEAASGSSESTSNPASPAPAGESEGSTGSSSASSESLSASTPQPEAATGSSAANPGLRE